MVPFPDGQIFWLDHSASADFSPVAAIQVEVQLASVWQHPLAGACQLSAHVLLFTSKLCFAYLVEDFFASILAMSACRVLLDCSNE